MSNESCTNENKDRFSIVLRKQTKSIFVHTVACIVTMVHPLACIVTTAGVEYQSQGRRTSVQTIRLILLRKTEYVHIFFCLDLTISNFKLVCIFNKTCVHMLHKHTTMWLGKLGWGTYLLFQYSFYKKVLERVGNNLFAYSCCYKSLIA